MAWDYQITVGGTAITTYAEWARFIQTSPGHKRGRNHVIPYRDGTYSDLDKLWDESDVLLEVGVKYPNANQNLSGLAAEFAAYGTVYVGQNHPYAGSIRAPVELLDEPRPTQARNVFLFPLRNPMGMWEDTSASSDAGNPPTVTTTGDRPISDMTLTFASNGYLEHTDSLGRVRRITLESGVPASTVVDCGARTVTQGGSNYDSLLTITGDQPSWWMRFEAGTSQSFTSNVSVTVSWRDKWAV